MSTNNDDGKREEIKDLCFHSKFDTKIYCGPDLIYIYNQAHVQYMNKSQHPSAFGRPFSESYPEHFDYVKTTYEK
ncbi:15099_t:CDS:2 [Dentiscutata erythropus]|uniref:15099_t:CDS:1 n=1 Tax=Dentiscutata erythropus TaxID=1348616 RepID=A0A9N8Z614_9GLOM|nr:15099_t:CDS:2 [Dentiscutata erythropus]